MNSCGAVGTRGSLNLGGYGVELALKNMEYKAMDDSAIKKGQFSFSLCSKLFYMVRQPCTEVYRA